LLISAVLNQNFVLNFILKSSSQLLRWHSLNYLRTFYDRSKIILRSIKWLIVAFWLVNCSPGPRCVFFFCKFYFLWIPATFLYYSRCILVSFFLFSLRLSLCLFNSLSLSLSLSLPSFFSLCFSFSLFSLFVSLSLFSLFVSLSLFFSLSLSHFCSPSHSFTFFFLSHFASLSFYFSLSLCFSFFLSLFLPFLLLFSCFIWQIQSVSFQCQIFYFAAKEWRTNGHLCLTKSFYCFSLLSLLSCVHTAIAAGENRTKLTTFSLMNLIATLSINNTVYYVAF